MIRRVAGAGAPAKILELLRRDKSVLVKDLCTQFGVTGETIRKDLSQLEREGLLIKTYGGAYIQDGVKNEIDVSIRKMLLPEEKGFHRRVLCGPGGGGGHRVFWMRVPPALRWRHLLHADITVVTNSLDIAQVFSESGLGKVLLSGGELDRKNRCFVGGSAEEFLSRYYVDKSFVSCRGADRAAGITDGSAVNGRIRAMMLRRAQRRYLVLDHTKLDKINFFRICGMDEVHAVVADAFPRRLAGVSPPAGGRGDRGPPQ